MIAKTDTDYTAAEVAGHRKEGDLWVIYKGEVYDVSEFAEDHPGGKEIIQEYAGGSIDDVFTDDSIHSHSQYAHQILSQYRIGRLVGEQRPPPPQQQRQADTRKTAPAAGGGGELSAEMKQKLSEEFIDLSKPLVPQVWRANWSKEHYLEQVHIPRYAPGSPAFFPHPLLDAFTKNHWWVIVAFWTPILVGGVITATRELNRLEFVRAYAFGMLLWTLYEYVFHRLIFHIDRLLPDNRAAITLHFCLHGVHHMLPMDKLRLVMPPPMFAMLAMPVGVFWKWICQDWASTSAIMSGSITGYLAYDLLHYFFHHGRTQLGYVQRMKTNHMDHHYVDPNAAFGVTSLIWDAIFGTLIASAGGRGLTPATAAKKSSKQS